MKAKFDQDNLILQFVSSTKPREQTKYRTRANHATTSKYFINNTRGHRMQVCQKTFCNILSIGQQRVKNVIKRSYVSSSIAVERRGGDRTIQEYSEAKTAVINFIKSLKVQELHYNREKVKRQYLPSDLSIVHLFRIYNGDSNNPKVKESYFRTIFNENFNLGFGLPRSDICSLCLRYSEEIQRCTDNNKVRLISELRFHKLRAKAFFSILKESRPGLYTCSYDCQKNMTLQKLPDQCSYFLGH